MAAGMLHDISSYKTAYTVDHSKLSSFEAKAIMQESKDFTEDEIATVCEMIKNHRDKAKIHDIYCELLKDSDVLQHYLYNTTFEIKINEKERLIRIAKELGINL